MKEGTLADSGQSWV